MKQALEIRPATWGRDAAALTHIRRCVFIDEQSVPEALELDGEDDRAAHWLALHDDIPVGTLRLLSDGHIGRLAVMADKRGLGIGSALLRAVLAYAREQHLREVYLHAQVHALSFYERHGFRAEGGDFLDAGILHRQMRLSLRARELGVDSGRFAVHDRPALALDLARQARRHLRILSNSLDRETYDNAEFASALSALVRQHRSTDIRLLVVDSRPLVQRGHHLLELQRRLSSRIPLRRVTGEPALIQENYLLADRRGILCYTVKEPEQAWGDYSNGPVAENYTVQFDELWNRAVEDPDLRVLNL